MKMKKQAKEKVQIPRYVAEWIEEQKGIDESILTSANKAQQSEPNVY